MGTLEWETGALGKASSDFHSQKPSILRQTTPHFFVCVFFFPLAAHTISLDLPNST